MKPYNVDLKPVDFPEANRTLGKPVDMTDEECSPLRVWSDGNTCVSCWKLSLRQRVRALLFGNIWLNVLSGYTQPPVCVCCDKTIFIHHKEETNA